MRHLAGQRLQILRARRDGARNAGGGGEAALTVHNTGEPIPAEDQAHLFERFYRADAARGRRRAGTAWGCPSPQPLWSGTAEKLPCAVRRESTAFTVTLPQEKGVDRPLFSGYIILGFK